MKRVKLNYSPTALGEENYDPNTERTMYDASYYLHYREELDPAVPFVRRFFLTVLPEFESIVDFGCGTGDYVKPLIDDGKDVIGVDFSDGSKVVNVLGDRFVEADLTKPLSLDREFDVLISFEVYEHIPAGEPEKAFLSNIKKMNPKWIVMSCAGYKVEGADTGELYPKMVKQRGRRHHNCLTLPDFASRLTGLGYEVDGIRTVLWTKVPRLPSYMRHNTLVLRRNDVDGTFVERR